MLGRGRGWSWSRSRRRDRGCKKGCRSSPPPTLVLSVSTVSLVVA